MQDQRFVNHQAMYHRILDADPATWERLREHAAQALGHPHSPMWSPMRDLHDTISPQGLQIVANSRAPYIAARALAVNFEHPAAGLPLADAHAIVRALPAQKVVP